MGLDNGILICNIERDLYPNVIKPGDQEIDVCYWRKCWGLRDDIIDILHNENQDMQTDEIFEYDLSLNSLCEISKLLKSYNEEAWSNSISSWENIKDAIDEDIKEVDQLIRIKANFPDVQIIFYDSY